MVANTNTTATAVTLFVKMMTSKGTFHYFQVNATL